MVKKMKSGAPAEEAGSSALAQAVKESAQQIWLAGMGAFANAQDKGSKAFESLIKEGLSLQKKTQSAAEEKLGEVGEKMNAMADQVTSRAGQNWDKLESIFESRTAKALARLGVPTAKELAALSQRVDALAAAVAKLGPAAPASAPRKRAAKAAAPAPAAAKPARKAARKTAG
ncbi:MAG: phasin family protein [Burkholderiales bacterium]|nr:phasin family protein [Burkholderiales bacterium]